MEKTPQRGSNIRQSILTKARDFRDDVADNLSDIKEFYGTTQHPLVGGIRDGVDSLTGETETGWAIGQIRRIDPAFDLQLFFRGHGGLHDSVGH